MFSFKVAEYEDGIAQIHTDIVPGASFKDAMITLITENFIESQIESIELKYTTDSIILVMV